MRGGLGDTRILTNCAQECPWTSVQQPSHALITTTFLSISTNGFVGDFEFVLHQGWYEISKFVGVQPGATNPSIFKPSFF